jgi:transcriptional regulator with XRE-family HTH domain
MKKIEPKLNNQSEIEMYKDISALLYIAQEVYGARVKANLSQKTLAVLVGTTQRIISNIENAEINVGFNLLHRIAKALNIALVVGSHKFVLVGGENVFKNFIMPINDNREMSVSSVNDSSSKLFNTILK